jgi:hypothetical protein
MPIAQLTGQSQDVGDQLAALQESKDDMCSVVFDVLDAANPFVPKTFLNPYYLGTSMTAIQFSVRSSILLVIRW